MSTSTRPTRITAATFQAVVGALLWLALNTRFDIAQAVGAASRYSNDPSPEAIEMVKRILRYLAGTPQIGITYHRSTSHPADLVAYSDADWGGEKASGLSTTGMLVLYNGSPIAWSSRKQQTVALSSTEAEYVAASETTRQVEWERNVLRALLFTPTLPPTPLHIDNRTAIQLIGEDNTTDRRKHINIKYHYIRQQAANDSIKPLWVSTEHQLADIFTKPLPVLTFVKLRDIVRNEDETQEHQPNATAATRSSPKATPSHSEPQLK